MKIFKRLTALFCTGGMLLMSAPHCVLTSHAAQTVKLSPDNTFTINNGECKRELWVVFNLQSNKIAFEYQSIIF